MSLLPTELSGGLCGPLPPCFLGGCGKSLIPCELSEASRQPAGDCGKLLISGGFQVLFGAFTPADDQFAVAKMINSRP